MGNHDQPESSKFYPADMTFSMWYAKYGDRTVTPDPSTVIQEFLLEFTTREGLSDFVRKIQNAPSSSIEILTTLAVLPVVAISTSYTQIEHKILPDPRIVHIYRNSPLYLCAEFGHNKSRNLIDFQTLDHSFFSFTGEGVRVALIDSGIHSHHPDLVHVDIIQLNLINMTQEHEDEDDLNGHGTYLASIIAGSGKASHGAYRGIAPEVELIDVKVFDHKGRGNLLLLLRALETLLSLPAKRLPHIVVFGGLPAPVSNPPNPPSLQNSPDLLGRYASLLVKHGIAVVAPTGNFGPDDGYICSPGRNPDVLCVGGIDSAHNIAFFSGRSGRGKPDIVLPAVNVIGAKSPTSTIGKVVRDSSTSIHLSGTSVSAANAAGLLALLKQSYPALTPHQLYSKLQSRSKLLSSKNGQTRPVFPDLVGILRADKKLLPKPLSYMTILKTGLKFALYFVVLAVLAVYFF